MKIGQCMTLQWRLKNMVNPPGGTQLFFRWGCATRISEVWGLQTAICLWKGGLVNWKFPNLGACELKFWQKLRLLRLKIPNFLKRGSCELTLLLEMGPLQTAGEVWKGGLQGSTSPYPLSRSVPPPGGWPEMSIYRRNFYISLKRFQISECHPLFYL